MSDRFYREGAAAGYRLTPQQMIARRSAAKAARGPRGGSNAQGGIEWKIDVEGIQEALREIEAMSGNVRAAISLATRRSGRIVLRKAKQVAPRETQALINSLASRTRTYQTTIQAGRAAVVSIIGPRRAYTANVRRMRVIMARGRERRVFYPRKRETAVPSNYVHLIALGVRPHSLGRKSYLARSRDQYQISDQFGAMHPGVRPRNFMQIAAEQAAGEVSQEFSRTIQAALARARSTVGPPAPPRLDVLDT